MAVVRFTERPPPGSECRVALWDLTSEKRLFETRTVTFFNALEDKPSPYALDVVPSFYYAEHSLERVTVFVVAPRVRETGRVASLSGEGDCEDPKVVPGGFTCVLPVVAPGFFYDAPMFFRADARWTHATGYVNFSVQPLRDDVARVEGVDQKAIKSGERLTLKLTAPLQTAYEVPWSPVLVHAETGKVLDQASFTRAEWDNTRTHLSAVLNCYDCAPGRYAVHLGEAVVARSGVVTHSSGVFVELRDA